MRLRIVGANVIARDIWMHRLWELCFGTLVWGVYNDYGQYYRFAAADAAAPDFKATAISLVLAGGLVGGILGPSISRLTVEMLTPKFMGAYLSLIGFALVTMALLRFIRIPNPTATEQAASGRPPAEIPP